MAAEGAPASAPNAEELAAMLGRSSDAFASLAAPRPGVRSEWRRYTKAGPWTLKVIEGKRTLYYLTPEQDEFHVSIILGEKATGVALAAEDVPEPLKADLRAARPYAEGRGIRVPVRGADDLGPIERLVAIKLDPSG